MVLDGYCISRDNPTYYIMHVTILRRLSGHPSRAQCAFDLKWFLLFKRWIGRVWIIEFSPSLLVSPLAICFPKNEIKDHYTKVFKLSRTKIFPRQIYSSNTITKKDVTFHFQNFGGFLKHRIFWILELDSRFVLPDDLLLFECPSISHNGYIIQSNFNLFSIKVCCYFPREMLTGDTFSYSVVFYYIPKPQQLIVPQHVRGQLCKH